MLTSFFGYDFFSITKKFIKAWIKRDKPLRILFNVFFFSCPLGILFAILGERKVVWPELFNVLTPLFIVTSCLSVVAIVAYQSLKDDKEHADEIKDKEDELEKNPGKSKTAWDLATIKLESYLNRNLSQVRWIFFWSVLIMIVGFGIIGYGIFKVYETPDSFQPSILVTLAGVITQVIGATLLLIYKSTMAQAKDYVNVLERINAVGMSIQVIDSLSKESDQLRDTAKAELAKELLKLYGNNPRHN